MSFGTDVVTVVEASEAFSNSEATPGWYPGEASVAETL